MSLELIYGLIYGVAVIIALIGLMQLISFEANVKSITDPAALERFKSLVRGQMYLALPMMLVLLAGIAVGIIICYQRGFYGVLAVVATNAAIFILGKFMKGIEKSIRARKPTSEPLAQEFNAICQTWGKKALPDF